MKYKKLKMLNTTEYSVYQPIGYTDYALWYKKGEGCRINYQGAFCGWANTLKGGKEIVENRIGKTK